MGADVAARLDLTKIETPCFVTDLGALERNLKLLADVQARAGCTIILALKGFAQWSTFPLVKRYLRGTTASSVAEARLGREEMGGEVHAYAPAWTEDDLREVCELVDHVVFNTPGQWKRLRHVVEVARAAGRTISCGLRCNPEHREVEVALYDPAAPCSRLGTPRANVQQGDLDGLEGLHFHTLCELGPDALERTLAAFEAKFGDLIPGMKWVNFGGGHHITRPGYDTDHLVRLVRGFRERWGVDVFLEPGEAVALGTGVLVASVLDVFDNGMPIAVLDTSATAHMPDVLEMPYRPVIVGAGDPGERAHTYRLGGLTCLAGDVIGDYSFDAPLAIGQKLVFLDMAHYTMVKTSTFNGVRLPSIATHDPATGAIVVSRRFGYRDYRDRLS
ncbi:MAG: carboxynorspermidine decarboxylase [Kofleriaceae bacterium]|nr:MAG: carboxynorspermidine decarboxylase [Kofleriaceae bacterium]MBZ0234476.1 carboxynorspermidine decarboxylase [Kofleriaceae bacterium]